MKLRVTNSSIRLRLSQNDVERFRADGYLSEELRVGPGEKNVLTFGLVRGVDSRDVLVTLENNQLIVSLSAGQADDWTATDRVGIEAKLASADSQPISILIEKDFACLTPRTGNDDKDSFPHPSASAGH